MNSRHRDYTFQRAILAAVFAVLLASPLAAGAKAVAANQSRFSTPEEAVAALARAAQAKDQTALAAIFGPDRAKLLTGDSVIDEKALEHFAVNLAKSHRLEKVTETKFTLLVGADNWPSPIPIVKDGGQWRFEDVYKRQLEVSGDVQLPLKLERRCV